MGSAANAEKLTAEKRQSILALVADGVSVERAAQANGVSRLAVFFARQNDPEFGELFDAAKEQSLNALEDHLLRQGTENGVPGNFVPVLAILKARRPQVWREQQNTNIQLNFTGSFAEAMTSIG